MQSSTLNISDDRAQLELARAQAFTAFDQARNPFAYLSRLTQLTDALIRERWQPTGALPPYCLIATGGYGRKELYPQSDIDFLLLHDGDEEAFSEPLTQLLHALWDLGFKIGHACRSMKGALALAKEDATIHTSLLDARLLLGSKKMFKALTHALPQNEADFIRAKLEERQARLERFGRSRFLLEPNVKEHAGGLRDLHMLYWLARHRYGVARISELVKLGVLQPEEYRRFKRSYRFIATVRILLHHWAGRADERLTFDRQQQLAEWLGYRANNANQPVERFMKRYFQNTGDINLLTRLFCATLEEEIDPPSRSLIARFFERDRSSDAFTLRHKRLDFADELDINAQPRVMLQLFAEAQRLELDIHPRAMQRISRHLALVDATLRKNAEANTLFWRILTSRMQPDDMLGRMNECGLIGKFITDFAYIVGQVQFDRYHVYTVDEHTIRLIGQLHDIERGALREELPIASDMIHQINSRDALLLAALCHDIAKGRGGSHESKGIDITRKLGKRFGLDSASINLAAWLVGAHLTMTHTAFSRDLDDPQTILDFTQEVQSPERLRCLLLLTVADIRAVGPGIWNGWKGALLRDLFAKAEAQMRGDASSEPETEMQHAKAQLLAKLTHWPKAARAKLAAESSSGFWLGLPQEHHAGLAALMRRLWDGSARIAQHAEAHRFEAITHVQLCLPDCPGLLYIASGCITRIGGSIQSIKSVTLSDGLVVMLLDIQDKTQHAYEDMARLERLSGHIVDALSDPTMLHEEVDKRRPKRTARAKALAAPPAVYLDNHSSAEHTLIEVNATDRIGLLYDITRALTSLKLNIVSSHITTYGEKAVDVFYVKDEQGQKLISGAAIDAVRSELMATLAYYELKE